MTNNPAPAGYTTVAPLVVTDDTGAFLDFVSAAFGGTELARCHPRTAASDTALSGLPHSFGTGYRLQREVS
jgi:hypothetical protein